MTELDQELMRNLIEFSNRYGKDPQYVLAGGGNTSAKSGGVMRVKASGTRLAAIGESGFVAMDRGALMSMFSKDYPADDAARESAALADMMAAVLPGAPGRPSVECMLHALFPQRYVLHLHPALVNGMTCARGGKSACRELFGEAAVWIPLTKPGYTLAKVCADAFKRSESQTGRVPNLLFMQNHGVIAAAETVAELDALMDMVMRRIGERVKTTPAASIEDADEPLESFDLPLEVAPVLRMLYARVVTGMDNGNAIAAFRAKGPTERFVRTSNCESIAPLLKPFNPDQIVYCKAAPLILNEGRDVTEQFAAFVNENGYPPKIAILPGHCVFALGKTKAEADTALDLFDDAAKIARYADAFGGYLPLTDEFTRFILNWEVENYRQKVSFTGGSAKRMERKVCVVTGAAQGFGEGIARAIAREGGYVVCADMNAAGAKSVADSLNEQYGTGTASDVYGLSVNVADEESVARMVGETVLTYGGLDVMIACAGIAIAGGLDTMTLDRFNKVAAVNYAGYYLCAKYAAGVMKRQRAAAPTRTGDIIEINSKSGLEGSKANFAYAGSKFGGIGLTQSFALELAEFGVKVNAICPGNLLDGPLWSDPEKGLFRQYLDAGKVPGAKTVADVRAFYEAKVPLGRGCTVEDVARAVFYIVEQQYETGQALPVTGGQVMLN
ncbi:MAG: SDR family oxidoreductase [Oscillospiraceae bacterium]|nr:SDR family oxidoreductase [Oscillospiraceae bacterium]